ncbi:MAG: ribosome-associated translation inhibitor RaiA [Lewinellaceae bacterium]|nr:ribosome-associated translation inhibitor RaiA [Lewinellaceae bacterium]
MTVHIETIHFTADSKLKDYIQSKMDKIEKLYNKSNEVNVTLKLENSGQVRDKITEIKMRVPGQDIFVSAVDKTFEASFDEALDTLKRQLKKYKEKMVTTR